MSQEFEKKILEPFARCVVGAANKDRMADGEVIGFEEAKHRFQKILDAEIDKFADEVKEKIKEIDKDDNEGIMIYYQAPIDAVNEVIRKRLKR